MHKGTGIEVVVEDVEMTEMERIKPKVEKKSSLKTVCQTVLASLVYVVRGEPADEC